jgi:hypothetical protein
MDGVYVEGDPGSGRRTEAPSRGNGIKGEVDLIDRATCARCGEAASTVVIELSALRAYLDLCEPHLAELLQNARPTTSPDTHDMRNLRTDPG